MASSDDFVLLTDCNNTNNFTASGGLTGFAANQEGIDGVANNAINVDKSGTGAGLDTVTYNLNGAGQNFRLDQFDFLFDFYYVKGKGAALLTDNASTVTVRIWFGPVANNDFVDYYFGGDSTLRFGWQTFGMSGLNYDDVPAGSTFVPADVSTPIQQIQLRLDFSTAAQGSDRPGVRIDKYRRGSLIRLGDGAADLASLKAYSDANFLGVVDLIGNVGAIVRTGIQCGDGGVPNSAAFVETGKWIQFQHFSEEVKHGLRVTNNSSFRGGELINGVQRNYPINGVQLICSDVRRFDRSVQSVSGYAEIVVDQGGILELYDSKIFRFEDVTIGGGGAGGLCVLNRVDVDKNARLIINQSNVDVDTLDIHDSWGKDDPTRPDQCAEVLVSPDKFDNVLCHDNEDGVHFRASTTARNYVSRDNTGFNLGVLDDSPDVVVDIIGGEFGAETSIRRLT